MTLAFLNWLFEIANISISVSGSVEGAYEAHNDFTNFCIKKIFSFLFFS